MLMNSINNKIVLFLFSFSHKGKRIQTGFLLVLLIFLSQSTIQAQSISGTTVAGAPVCAGSEIIVSFTATNSPGNKYDNNTIYTLYLSSSSGSSFTQIAVDFSTTEVSYSNGANASTSISQTVTIPSSTSAGTNYTIAVGSTSPSFDASSGVGATAPFEIKALPSVPGVISGAAMQCPAFTAQTYSIAPVVGASAYTWTVPLGWSITSGAGTRTIIVTTGSAGQNGDITVTTENSCGASAAQTLAVTVSPTTPVAPIPIAGSNSACTSITASWSSSVSATRYFLDISNSSSFGTFVSGYNNRSVGNVLTSSVTGLIAGTTYYYRVRATNSCGTSASSAVISYETAAPSPSILGTIAGTATQCSEATGQSYSVAAVTNATNYNWTVPTGWSITSGSGTTSIIVTTGSAAQNGNITVTADNSCGMSAVSSFPVTVVSCINKWKGSISSDWNSPGNWTQNLVPAVDANIVFDDLPENDCYMDQDRTVMNITNSQTTYSIVVNGYKLSIKGNLLFSGGATIDASALDSKIQFSGATVQTINSGVFKNDAVYNLDINNLNNVLLRGNLRLFNNLTTTSGLFDAFTNSPTIIYTGSTLQTIGSNQFLGGKVDKLIVNNAIGVNVNTNFSITNALVINAGKKLSVSSLNQLTVLGTISNNGGASGLTLKSDTNGTASLIHNSDNVPATVQRYISGPIEGWHFMSSPVFDQGISGSWLPMGSYGTGNSATGTGYDLYVWDEPSFSFKYKQDATVIGWNSVHPGINFNVGRGYLYSVQEKNPTKEFIGNLNNGSLNCPMSNTATVDPLLVDLMGFNLVGNPYPSSIDWQAASGWDRTILEVSGGGNDMWVWNPSANNYGVFNSVSGVGTNSISRYLAPMQGYFVKAASNGNLVFDNTVRVHDGAGNWFKNSGIKNSGIRIAVKSEDGNGADEALIQFGYSDSNQGASKLFSHVSSAPSLYLSLDRKNYSVRYLTNTAENNSVPMEFKAGKEGGYKLVFNFDSKEFDFIQLEDRLLKTYTSIKPSSSYLFKSSKEYNVSRFVLHFTAAEITTKNELDGLVYMDGSQIAVDLKGVNGQTEIKVFDNTGKLILQKNWEGSVLTKLDLNLATQILLVRLINEKGTSSTKVLYNPLQK
jgi:hypothetical protein